MVNPLANAGNYSKSIVAVAGAVVTVLTTVFPAIHWESVITGVEAGLTVLGVYLIPNSPNTPRPAQPAAV